MLDPVMTDDDRKALQAHRGIMRNQGWDPVDPPYRIEKRLEIGGTLRCFVNGVEVESICDTWGGIFVKRKVVN